MNYLAIAGTATILATAGMASAQTMISIDSGKIDGIALPSGVRAWLGVPFAAPPVRELRWRAPQAVAPWRGVYHADRKGPECIQLLRRKDINHYFGEEATSEDCLYLNVWSPAKAGPKARLPVIVFIHGGGFTVGSSGMALYGGENVAARGDAVFVNMNYRLGILGYMAHPELTAESAQHASGNYGFLDQIAALQWVQKNIARFGGDPSRVTISGQSAGAASVGTLLASPLAKGLFQRAVLMSGAGVSNNAPSLAESEQTGLEVQKAVGATSLDEMRKLPADKVFAAQRDFQFGVSGSVTVKPNIDGYVLPDTIPNIYAAGKQNDVPVMAGFTADDISFSPLRGVATLAQFRTIAASMYGDRAQQFLDLYPAASDADAARMSRVYSRQAMIEKGTRALALAQQSTGKAPFYMFLFSHVQPFNPVVQIKDNPQGAYHTSDVPYWFQTQDALNMFRATRNWQPYDRALSKRMMDSLLAFARSGNPATPATPWPQWRPDSAQYLEFGDDVTVQSEDAAQMEFQNQPVNIAPGASPLPRGTRD
ncbi:para-nitrobenzyl esterase [Duganella sp. CF402]|uniref:carboxylesterase/lipase family protein n=1 Tax=unclassified Duganella TaxID=2636909 RepID=UPI0008B81FBF|nr:MULTISPECIES: carboxylesterase family protein [unclassified Duganella]RZT09788.1 para-nitrobenzyl esterase [Duganella sp. BK701]SEL42803.1 para-nitrobenzyl esterase [Duganella sp. CF402]